MCNPPVSVTTRAQYVLVVITGDGGRTFWRARTKSFSLFTAVVVVVSNLRRRWRWITCRPLPEKALSNGKNMTDSVIGVHFCVWIEDVLMASESNRAAA